MPQGSGLMNTAPMPIPGGYGNPAGANIGLPTTSPGSGVPNPWGNLPTSLTPATQKTLPNSLFPANTGSSTGSAIPSGMAGLSSGFSTNDPGRTQNLYNYLGKAFGKGPGQLLGNMITQGLFNPQVAQALMNAMEPTIQRGFQDVLGAFGSEGARFSSSAQIGAGDYMSQARLGQEGILANMFQQDQQMQLQLLENVLPAIKQERADEGGWLNTLIGGLEAVGGVVAAPFTGGASLALTAQGLGTLTGGHGGGGGGGGMGGGGGIMSLQSLFQPGSLSSLPTSGAGGGQAGAMGNWDAIQQILMSQSAGESLGMPTGSGSPLGGGMYDENGVLVGMH